MTNRDRQIGVREQKTSLLTTSQLTTIIGGFSLVVALVLWHVTLVINTDLAWGDAGATVRALISGHPIAGLRGSGSTQDTGPILLTYAALVVFYLLVLVAVMVALTGKKTTAIAGMASRQETRRSAGEQTARDRARYPRSAAIARGLNIDTCPLQEVALRIGQSTNDREPVIIANSDQIGVVAPTGAGKTLYVVVGACIDAPGPLVATSTKPEILDAVVEQRAHRGRIWVFDPLDRAGWPEPMIWNPVTGAKDAEMATARGLAFAAGAGVENSHGNGAFFTAAAGIVMARMLHAAALDGRTIQDVLAWTMDIDRSADAATQILQDDPEAELMWAKSLEVATKGADETISSTRMTLGQKIEPLLSRKVLRQMLPQQGVAEFDARQFVQSQDTLILITDDQAPTNVAPLTTMLLDEVIAAGKAVASRLQSGFLDPPMRIVGDEIANVAPLPKLPSTLSDSRGYGIQWLTVFQSLAQMIARWGEDGANQILANLNATIVMGGLQDRQALQRFSDLVGSQEMATYSATLDDESTSISSRNMSMSERTLLRPEHIRMLPDGQALVLNRNAPAMIVDLVAWTARPDADAIRAGMAYIRGIRTRKAS